MTNQEALYIYLLRLGDNALINGHRLAEWCSRGPFLEEDLAMTNIALDNIGRSQAFLKYAAAIDGKGKTEDDLAYKRGEREFYNHLITELPIGDFAYTVAKQLIMSCFDVLVFTDLSNSKDETIAGIAAKALKESRYHFVHARDWSYRLGKGTEESHRRYQNAIQDLWMYTGELFEMNEVENILLQEGISNNLQEVRSNWINLIMPILQDSSIRIPTVDYMQTGSCKGIHSEHLGHILSDMQYLQRAYPDAKW